MMFILDLLNKIKWDSKENPEDYIFYYHDRIEKVNKELKFKDIKKVLSLYVVIKKEDKEVYIPLHRMREVRKNNKIIWKR